MPPTIQKGLTFAMDPRRSDLGLWDAEAKRWRPRPASMWIVLETDPMFATVAPVDACCIPPRVTIASLERAFEAFECRPASPVKGA